MITCFGLFATDSPAFAKLFRCSPLAKRYGYGIHADQHARVALVGADTAKYAALQQDPHLTQLKAMRNKKA